MNTLHLFAGDPLRGLVQMDDQLTQEDAERVSVMVANWLQGTPIGEVLVLPANWQVTVHSANSLTGTEVARVGE